MKIIVNDANILIDLIELRLLPNFFALEFEFLTTSLVFEELLEDQQFELNEFIEIGVLLVHEMTQEQLAEINEIQKNKPSLSPQDCSAFYQAKIEEGILVTSDNTLRKFAKSNEMDVHGHLWVFDRMYEAETISGAIAIEKLNELCNTINQNLGLPINECNRRIESWK
jgi:predicted nucleic acid-binding protein